MFLDVPDLRQIDADRRIVAIESPWNYQRAMLIFSNFNSTVRDSGMGTCLNKLEQGTRWHTNVRVTFANDYTGSARRIE